jgi:hypothetical protein
MATDQETIVRRLKEMSDLELSVLRDVLRTGEHVEGPHVTQRFLKATVLEMAERTLAKKAAAVHAPPSIPDHKWRFTDPDYCRSQAA